MWKSKMISDTRVISSFLKKKKWEIALDMEMSQIGLKSEQTFFHEIFFLTFRSSKRGSTEHRGDGIFRRDELLETSPRRRCPGCRRQHATPPPHDSTYEDFGLTAFWETKDRSEHK